MRRHDDYPFDVEWLPNETQIYHGPRKRMRTILRKHPVHAKSVHTQAQVIEFLIATYPNLSRSIDKVKFYRVPDREMMLRFFILWCGYDVEAREVFFEQSDDIVSRTGWYPMVTGHRVFHHRRRLVDIVDTGLRKSMNKTNIEALPGLGALLGVNNLSKGQGTSIVVHTSTYDIVLDAGMSDDDLKLDLLRHRSRKWVFISHSHKDHTGGMKPFVQDKKFVISASPITLELFLCAVSDHVHIGDYFPKNFFYRFAPMWYRSHYRFSDGSSIETVPTYHFPGSMGFIFRFNDGKTLFYSGDLNVSASYLSSKRNVAERAFTFSIGRRCVDYAILDGAFVGRSIGSAFNEVGGIMERVKASLANGRNHLFLTPPSDYGLFLFLHLYDELVSSPQKVRTRIFLDPGIIRQLEILEWRMKRKRKGSLDDALVRFLASRVTLAESVRVFDAGVNLEENLRQLHTRNLQVVMILDDSRCGDYLTRKTLSYLENPGLDVSRVGRAATRPVKNELIEESRMVDLDGGIWLLHSQEQLLQKYLLSGSQQYGHVFLFHNFRRRLERFIKRIHVAGYQGTISPLRSYTVRVEAEEE